MTVRHSPVLSGLLMVVGFVDTVVFGWQLLDGEAQPVLAVAVLVLFLGVRQVRRPYFRVETDAVVIVALVGSHDREIPIAGGSVAVRRGRLVLRPDPAAAGPARRPRRLPVRRAFAHRGDWRAVAAALPRG